MAKRMAEEEYSIADLYAAVCFLNDELSGPMANMIHDEEYWRMHHLRVKLKIELRTRVMDIEL